jgi:branched-chain amino acid transport system substrate-binding protein
VAELGITSALISSDGLLSGDFVSQTSDINQGMYLSGPALVPEDQAFAEKYRTRYGEDPNASYHLQGYDAAMLIFEAIKQTAVSNGGTLLIGRQAIRDAIRGVRAFTGVSGPLTCSQYGDCASPNISIFQVRNSDFSAIYP